MKIAILSFYSGQIERGAENWSYELSKGLSKYHQMVNFQNERGHHNSFQIVSTNLQMDWNRPDYAGSIKRLLFIDYWSIAVAKFTIKILPILWKENFEVIIPTNGGWQSAFIRILTWLRGSKMIIVGVASYYS